MGSVVLNNGNRPPEKAVVQATCSGLVRGTTYTDSRGDFSLVLGEQSLNSNLDFSVDSNERFGPQGSALRMPCFIRAKLAGFISSEFVVTRLSEKNLTVRLILRQIGGFEAAGSTVSLASLQVPGKARNEYEKALKKLDENDMQAAEAHLLKAVRLYNKYAAAFVLLARIQEQRNQLGLARDYYARAQEGDSHFAPGFARGALLAARENQWEEALKLARRAIEIEPSQSVQSRYVYAAANFNLGRLAEAEKAALAAAAVDRQHQQPRIQLLLAHIFEAKGNHAAAAKGLREYLKLVPESADARQAREQLAAIEARAAAAAAGK